MRPSGARTAVGPIQVRAAASHHGRHRLICGGRSRAGVARPDGRRAKAPSSATSPLTDLLRWRQHGWAIDTFASQPAAGRANPCDLKRRAYVESRIDTFTLAFGTLFLRSTDRIQLNRHRLHGSAPYGNIRCVERFGRKRGRETNLRVYPMLMIHASPILCGNLKLWIFKLT